MYNMKHDWNLRAKANAMYYIATNRQDWTIEDFYAYGAKQAEVLVRPALAKLGITPQGTLLEIGCGMGRLFPGFRQMGFTELIGIDVSETMIEKAKTSCPVAATFLVGNGQDLRPIADNSVDYCFSYIVFQHFPSRSLIWSYLAEVARVLKPGRAFQLHFRRKRTLKEFMAIVLPKPILIAIRLLRGRRLIVPGTMSTWHGVAVSPRLVEQKCAEVGLELVCLLDDFAHEKGTRFWAIGRKPA